MIGRNIPLVLQPHQVPVNIISGGVSRPTAVVHLRLGAQEPCGTTRSIKRTLHKSTDNCTAMPIVALLTVVITIAVKINRDIQATGLVLRTQMLGMGLTTVKETVSRCTPAWIDPTPHRRDQIKSMIIGAITLRLLLGPVKICHPVGIWDMRTITMGQNMAEMIKKVSYSQARA